MLSKSTIIAKLLYETDSQRDASLNTTIFHILIICTYFLLLCLQQSYLASLYLRWLLSLVLSENLVKIKKSLCYKHQQQRHEMLINKHKDSKREHGSMMIIKRV